MNATQTKQYTHDAYLFKQICTQSRQFSFVKYKVYKKLKVTQTQYYELKQRTNLTRCLTNATNFFS